MVTFMWTAITKPETKKYSDGKISSTSYNDYKEGLGFLILRWNNKF